MAASFSPVPLPLDLSSFVGRERELADLTAWVGRSRLLTLTGPGGSGKTRLVLELARRLRADRPVTWVDLADARHSAALWARLEEALGVPVGDRGHETLGLSLPPGVLLVLDNCEHLIESVAPVVERLLLADPSLSVVATSREPLGVRGERAWLVPPLSLDDGGGGPGEAVRLFVDRAQEVVPSFEPDEDGRAAVLDICRALDGIPLAIELAAARVRVMTPRQILDRLGDALGLLSSGGRTAVPRHRTLRATLDWSHDLLEAPARALFRRLGVFAGGATLEAVEEVGGGAPVPEGATLDVLARLVDRSLVTVREHGSASRYHLLTAVRQYAVEHLDASGEGDEIRGRHAAFMARLVEDARPRFLGSERGVWLSRLAPELANLRSALAWSRGADLDLHVRLSGSLWWFWFPSHHWPEAREWLEGAVQLTAERPPDARRAELLFALGVLDTLRGDGARAIPRFDEARSLAEELGLDELADWVAAYRTTAAAQTGAAADAASLEATLERFRSRGDLSGVRLSLMATGSARVAAGDACGALASTAEAVSVARSLGQTRELGTALQCHGSALVLAGQAAQAEQALIESLAVLVRDPAWLLAIRAVHYLGIARSEVGDGSEAVRLLAAADAARGRLGTRASVPDARAGAEARARLEARLGAQAFAEAWTAGAALDFDGLVAELVRPSAASVWARGATAAAPSSPPVAEVGPAADGTSSSSGPVPDLRVRLLGGFGVEVRGTPVPAAAWAYAKPREMLALLALHPDGRTRVQIGEAMWPDAAPAQAKNSVHVTLHHLRKALGAPEWVVFEDERYRLAPDLTVETDVGRFESEARSALSSREGRATSADLLEVVESYRGDLLAGEIAGRWVDDERDRLRRLWREVALAAGSVLEVDGRFDDAEGVYRALVGDDELDEEPHRRLMSLWASHGERPRALRHYQALADTLRDELQAEPEAATRALLERLQEGEVGTPA